MNADVVICIPTFNQAAFLAEAVTSALGQGDAVEHVLVSDDASTDETAAVMQRFVEEPRVKYRRHATNRGLVGNNNWLLSNGTSKYLIRLDSDDRLLPGYLATLRELLEQHPRAAFAHAAVNEIDKDGKVRRVRRLARPAGVETAKESLRALTSGYRVAANICLFRRSALDEVEHYRAGLNFAEDWDLAVRLADRGWGNVYSDRVLAEYRVWTDPHGVRVRRKVAEIDGCRRVFTESLEPAYRKRGWPAGPLKRRRESLALTHALAIHDSVFDASEKEALIEALGNLGDSPRLRRRLQMLSLGFGPWYRWRERAVLRSKDVVKRLLHR